MLSPPEKYRSPDHSAPKRSIVRSVVEPARMRIGCDWGIVTAAGAAAASTGAAALGRHRAVTPIAAAAASIVAPAYTAHRREAGGSGRSRGSTGDTGSTGSGATSSPGSTRSNSGRYVPALITIRIGLPAPSVS